MISHQILHRAYGKAPVIVVRQVHHQGVHPFALPRVGHSCHYRQFAGYHTVQIVEVTPATADATLGPRLQVVVFFNLIPVVAKLKQSSDGIRFRLLQTLSHEFGVVFRVVLQGVIGILKPLHGIVVVILLLLLFLLLLDFILVLFLFDAVNAVHLFAVRVAGYSV